MTRPSDWQQRDFARDLHRSCIVQAPAGSGKTELLTQRMLALLAQVENPEEVVAITFTRKASAEMSHRLFNRLQAAAREKAGISGNVPLQEHEQISRDLAHAVLQNDSRQGWSLLEQPCRLRIRTIDSLCSELARQLPVLSGLGGGQQVAVDANALYRSAAERTLAVIEDTGDELQADVIQILNRYDNQYDTLVELLTGMLACREQWIGHLLDARQGDGFNRLDMQQALGVLIGIQLKKAREKTPDSLLDALPVFYHFALSNSPTDEAELKDLLASAGGPDCDFLDLPVTADALGHWKTMIRRFLTANGKKWRAGPDANAGFPAPSRARGEERDRLRSMKDGFTALLDELRGDDSLREVYNTILSLPNPEYEDEAWESLESLMRILLRAELEWNLVMAETGEVDFTEIAIRAIGSLGFENAPSELALRMDYRIQHLLVDEFQDTSASQIRLLEKLTAGWSDGDGRTLFLVGDPMQSIYRFRKAEVSLFIKAWQGNLFNHIRLEPLQLTVNFRSTRPIVEWVNRIFPEVMPPASDPVMGAVSYSEAGTRPAVAENGTVGIQVLPERDDVEEARRVVELIGQSGPEESIAILVRSRSHASAILASLDRLKLDQPRYRYQAIKFMPLAKTGLIQDLVSLTLAIMQPADRLAWLATLRAPFAGLDLTDLDTLVAGNCDGVILDAISAAAAQDDHSAYTTNGWQRLQRIGPVLCQAVARRGRQSVRSLVEPTWIRLGGPACVGNASELDDAATYFDLLDALELENLPLDRDTLDLRMKELYAQPDAEANGKLQILTIYAAKGLQFDTVILPGLNRPPGGDKNKLLHWFELPGENRIVMSPMRNAEEKERQKKSGDLIKFIAYVEKQRQRLEDGRLLYVAATRAVHSLHLLAAIKANAQGDFNANPASLMGGLWPAIMEQQTPLLQQATENILTAEDVDPEAEDPAETSPLNLPRVYRRLPADWKLPPAPAGLSLPMEEHAEARDYIEFSWAGEDARLAGNIVHRLMQVIGEKGLESWTANGGMSGRANWCRQYLLGDGVLADKAETVICLASRAIENCLASEQGRWILGDHEDAHCEYAITAVLDHGVPKNLVLDRTFVADGVRWIIDYKTSSHGGGNLEGFLENEAERYREQLRNYRMAMAKADTRPIKTALYFPLLDQFLEVN